MKFIIDAQLPPALARVLRVRGFDAAHVAEIGLLDASDIQIAEFVATECAVLLTKDADFVQIQRRGLDATALRIVWIRLGNISSRTLIERILASMPMIEESLRKNERRIELGFPPRAER